MLSDEERQKIIELDKQGWTAYAIGKEINRDPKTVINFLKNGQEDTETLTPGGIKRHKTRQQHPFTDTKREVIPVSNPSQTVVAKREDTEMTELELRKQKAVKELEKVVGPKEHPALQEKRARVEVAKLSVEEFEAQKKLEALKKEEVRKAQAEREAHLQRIEEAERIREEEERREKRQRWIKEWQDWVLSWGISLPWGVSLPATLKFQIKDAVRKVLENRSEDERRWDIEEPVKDTAQAIVQPYLNELETKRKAEEAKRKRAKKIELINRALGEVDDYIKRNRLEPYVNEEAKKKIREQIYNHLLETLPEDIWYVSDSQVREILDSALKDTKEKVREAERKEFREKLREIKVKDLVQAGMNRLSYYLIVTRELGTVTPKEREEARQYLERELKREVEGTETVQEVEKIANEILDDFFFES